MRNRGNRFIRRGGVRVKGNSRLSGVRWKMGYQSGGGVGSRGLGGVIGEGVGLIGRGWNEMIRVD